MRHFINGQEVAPRNINEIGVVSDFTDDPNELKLNVDSVILVREGYELVKQHLSTNGIFEGIPYTIEMDNGISLSYYIDLTDNATFRDHECEVKIKKRVSHDNFFDRAEGISFELLKSKQIPVPYDLIKYVIVKDNAGELALTLSISTFVMVKEIADATKELAEALADLQEALTPIIGIGIPPTISFNYGKIISNALKLTARIVYFTALLVALREYAIQLANVIFPPAKTFKAVKLKTLLEVSAQYLGYTFKSSILDSYPNFSICTVPLQANTKSLFLTEPYGDMGIKNSEYPSSSDTIPTIKSLFDACEVMFNAKTKVENNGIVRLERRDYWQNQTTAQILPALVLQGERSDEFTYNTGDIWKRYYIHYQTDFTDLHTTDTLFNYVQSEYSTEPVSFQNEDLVMIKGLNEVNIPFALGARKDRLNWIEEIAKGVLTVVDKLTGIFGGGTSFASQISARKDYLMISQQYFATTKLLYLTGAKQNSDYTNYISAKFLWDNFHYINQINLYDYQIKTDARLQLTSSDFVTLLNNNYAEIDGLICEILRIEWIDSKSFAQITYRKPFDYTTGKVTLKIIKE